MIESSRYSSWELSVPRIQLWLFSSRARRTLMDTGELSIMYPRQAYTEHRKLCRKSREPCRVLTRAVQRRWGAFITCTVTNCNLLRRTFLPSSDHPRRGMYLYTSISAELEPRHLYLDATGLKAPPRQPLRVDHVPI